MVRALCIAVIAARIVYSVGCDCGGAVSTPGTDSGASDGGAADAGPTDAGTADAGVPDGGAGDAGTLPILLLQGLASSLGLDGGSVPLPSLVRSGDVLIVTIAYSSGGSIDSVQDTLGDSFTLAVDGGNGDTHLVFFAAGVDGGPDSIDIAASGAFIAPGPLIHVFEYQGLRSSSPLDQVTDVDGNSTSASASITVSFPNELIYAFCGSPSVLCGDAGSGFALLENSAGDVSADLVAPDAGTYAVTFPMGSRGPWNVIMTSFRGF